MSTAGKLITGQDLRAFAHCSRFYDFGGSLTEYEPPQLINKTAFELMTSAAIRHPISNYLGAVVKAIPRAVKTLGLRKNHLGGQVDAWENEALRFVPAIFETLSPLRYFPISGPMPWRVQISRTPVEVTANAIYRTRANQTLHVIHFSPYKTTQDQLNDPVANILLHSTKELVKEDYQRPRVMVHVFGRSGLGQMTYNSIESKTADEGYTNRLTSMVRAMEVGYSYPATPCPNSLCPFRKQCLPRIY
jgi:hypothetical protein